MEIHTKIVYELLELAPSKVMIKKWSRKVIVLVLDMILIIDVQKVHKDQKLFQKYRIYFWSIIYNQ